MKKLICTAMSMRQLPIDVDDFSVICFPALRALEAFMKVAVVKACGWRWDDFKDVFDVTNDYPPKYLVKKEIKARIACEITCEAVEKCYPYYKAHRHGMFHADGVDAATRILDTRSEALGISQTALGFIEQYSRDLAGK